MRFGVILCDGYPVGTIELNDAMIGGASSGALLASYSDGDSETFAPGDPHEAGHFAASHPMLASRGTGGAGYISQGGLSKATTIVNDLMKNYGLSRNRAIGLAANLAFESGDFKQYHELGQPADQGGVGWAQWTGARRHEFEQWAADHGLDPHSDAANLGFLHHELDDTVVGRKTLTELRAGPDSIAAATAIAERDYEGAGIPAIEGRIGKGNAIARAMDHQSISDVVGNKDVNASQVLPYLEEQRRRGMITNEQCVSLATAAVGIRLGDSQEGSNVHEWRRGENAESGALKPGTPVATFLDRAGQVTDRYAGGGAGTPGAHLDHAAVFESYIRDASGRITGMNVSEQYAGSGGIHQRPYMFGRGWGEGDASNYYVIKTDKGYLGGSRNPMSAPKADSVPGV